MESSGVLEFARVLAVTVFALLVVVGLVFIGTSHLIAGCCLLT